MLLRFAAKISASAFSLPLLDETGDAVDESSLELLLPELIFLLSNFFATEYDTLLFDVRCQLISIDRINYFSLIIFVNEKLFIFQKIKTVSSIIWYYSSLHSMNAPDYRRESLSFIWKSKLFVIDFCCIIVIIIIIWKGFNQDSHAIYVWVQNRLWKKVSSWHWLIPWKTKINMNSAHKKFQQIENA